MSRDKTQNPFPIPDGYESIFESGFNGYLGPIYMKEQAHNNRHFILPVRQELLNAGGVVHGGVLMSLADVALGVTVVRGTGRPAATISLDCNFVAAGKLGEVLEAEAEITRATRDVVFVKGRVYTETRTLLTAQGIWKHIHLTPRVTDPS